MSPVVRNNHENRCDNAEDECIGDRLTLLPSVIAFGLILDSRVVEWEDGVH